ncbi:hypothetical protein LCB40_11310 [Lactobacillus corticis]|uniref:Uncharacterized protein n=1 Tax=Lactobacillus corticis TaxID=2201249 RepID=A0A916QH37_9LACO|nr:hypothetical protein LCB40_11310 [Lactobacillus corticis]
MSGKNTPTNKKPFSDLRWREWPTTGIKTYGKPNKKVHETLQKWIKETKEKDNGKR